MKKCYVLIISLIIIFGTYNFLIQNGKKQTANEAFKQSLSEAASCFAVDYSKFDEEDKIYYYMKAASNLHTAMYILPFTSYKNVNNKNQDLEDALSRLYLSISLHSTPQSTNRLRAFNEKEIDIYKCLNYISLNPNDKNNCKVLAKIAEEIGY
ncbi:hypothetical protein JK636_03270 [Clostridium sp. YIM B02515]|uniref:Lipoprotein n=1 Tax=Clostridium rhizosphaerae TaxID=2803861 RepID=A0ABS1T7Y1_9CLOT|nr:hypothetical protein [Clostridium rhizosphaerae]MBL4934776.1 hypothetical protein [Clostridium rhizosphaerae]